MPNSSRTRRDPTDAREAIRRVATDQFLRNGYEATTLEQIATHLGITRPAVLYHYKSKETLLTAITEPVLTAIRDTITSLPMPAEPTRDQQATAIRAFIEVLADNRAAVALMTRFTTASQIGDIGSKLFALNERAARTMAGDAFDTDPLVRIRVVGALASIIGIMSARIPVDLSSDAERETLAAGVLALLTS